MSLTFNKYTMILKKLFAGVVGVALVIPMFSFAQVPVVPVVAATRPCVALARTLAQNATDAETSGEVTVLQKFLIERGHLVMPVGVATGFYGNATAAAVRKFQQENGLESVGMVGPKTRTRIQALCGKSTQETPFTVTSIDAKTISISEPKAGTTWKMGEKVAVVWEGPMQQVFLRPTTSAGDKDSSRPQVSLVSYSSRIKNDGRVQYTVRAPVAPGYYNLEVVSKTLGVQSTVERIHVTE